MADIEQFVPPQTSRPSQDDLRESMRELCPGITDENFEALWAGYVAMMQRVNNPRRRIGSDVTRKGPVLFETYHCIRQDISDVEVQE